MIFFHPQNMIIMYYYNTTRNNNKSVQYLLKCSFYVCSPTSSLSMQLCIVCLMGGDPPELQRQGHTTLITNGGYACDVISKLGSYAEMQTEWQKLTFWP